MNHKISELASLKIFIEDAGPIDKNVLQRNIFFERKGDDVEIVIQEQKRGGRTYHHMARLDFETLMTVVAKLHIP